MGAPRTPPIEQDSRVYAAHSSGVQIIRRTLDKTPDRTPRTGLRSIALCAACALARCSMCVVTSEALPYVRRTILRRVQSAPMVGMQRLSHWCLVPGRMSSRKCDGGPDDIVKGQSRKACIRSRKVFASSPDPDFDPIPDTSFSAKPWKSFCFWRYLHVW